MSELPDELCDLKKSKEDADVSELLKELCDLEKAKRMQSEICIPFDLVNMLGRLSMKLF